MRRLGIVACSKTKLPFPAPAGALYSSPLFRKSMLAAIDATDKAYILSALHGVLPLDRAVAPYDVTLKTMQSPARAQWADMVTLQLSEIVRQGDLIQFYAGEEYFRATQLQVERLGARPVEVLGRRSLGPRLRELRRLNEEDLLRSLLAKVQLSINRLWQAQAKGREFVAGKGTHTWPNRGVYLILDSADTRSSKPPRIVRIGTHAVSRGSKTSLWHRLSTHRGTLDGRGSHRSSIFRSHVGQALMRTLPEQAWPRTWAAGQVAPAEVRQQEVAHERLVSSYLLRYKVLWLNVPDEPGPDSDRAYIERNLIGLFSRIGYLMPLLHRGWLGEMSPEWRIASTGLWNIDHVFYRPDCEFADIFAKYVDITLGVCAVPTGSLAPPGWRKRRSSRNGDQLSLFRTSGDSDEDN